MKRQDWLLVFVALPLPEEGPTPLDPIRIMKGMFLFSQQAGGQADVYRFEPYHYGPCSFDIYSDLDALELAGLIRRHQATGQLWSYAEATSTGSEKASRLAESTSPELVQLLMDQKRFVLSRPFGVLLKEVYRRYPQFASRSIVSFR